MTTSSTQPPETPKAANTVMDATAMQVEQTPMGQKIVPQVPEGMSAEMANSLKDQATELMTKIMAAPDDQNLLEQVATLGIHAEQDAGQKIDLLNTKIHDVVNPPKLDGGKAPDSLADLRKLSDKLDPTELSRPTFFEKLMSVMPGFAEKQLQRSVDRIRLRTSTAEDEISAILDHLRDASETILRSNADIDAINGELGPNLVMVKGAAYLCEEMMCSLQDEYNKLAEDSPKKSQLLNFYTFVSSRYLDFNSMRELYNQLLIGLGTARQNNIVRSVSLQRTISIAGPALRIGTALQIIDIQQQMAAKLEGATRDFVSELMVRNAENVSASQKRSLEDMSSAALAIEKMKQAHDILNQAMDERDKLQQQVIKVAQENAIAFKQMAEQLESRQKKVQMKAPEKAANSIEAKV